MRAGSAQSVRPCGNRHRPARASSRLLATPHPLAYFKLRKVQVDATSLARVFVANSVRGESLGVLPHEPGQLGLKEGTLPFVEHPRLIQPEPCG